jgi:biofilm PGA synthesis N-glycosyltransferase PgaC
MMTPGDKYIIITPVRDEEQYIELTLKSVIAQTITPSEWIIVNDGSSDNTGRIIDEYAEKYPWIHPIHRENRGFRQAGGGVVEAFYHGYKAIKSVQWDYVVKLDGDLSFDTDYFERIFEYFRKFPEIGIGGGLIYNVVNNDLITEPHPLFHVRGATKIYKKECWDALGGLIYAPGWDTLDEVKANMLGWKTQTYTNLKVIHHRYTGAVDGHWKTCVKYGRANYISGYHPMFMFLKCIKRVFQKPYLLGSVGLAYGFASGYLKRVPQINDKKLIDYIRKQQLNKLTLRDSIWK